MSQSTREGTKIQAGTEHLTESEYHRLLAAEQRRAALDVLVDRTAPVELEALAAAVSAHEDRTNSADEKSVERVARKLHHLHLPKMDELGVIDYDPDKTRVESCPRPVDS